MSTAAVLLILHLVVVGGVGVLWASRGYRKGMSRWVLEGVALTVLAIVNTFIAGLVVFLRQP